jgi:hypothetical protein
VTAPASNSVLIVFLPLIGAVVGGVVGAWANSWYRGRETKKAEDRERLALLRLIDLEIFDNNKLLDDEDAVSLFDVLAMGRLRTESWDGSAARLTQLLPPLTVHALAAYYSLIVDIQAATESPATPRDDSVAKILAERGSRAVEMGNATRWLINHEYFEDADPVLPVPEPPDEGRD